jgi:RND family efflux transporter MFP subunit
MKKYFIISITVILLVLLTLGGKRLFQGESIMVVHPARGTAVQAVYATGTVEPTVMMPIAPRSSARLLELKVDEGSAVIKDQLLAQLEDDDLQHSIKQFEAREEFAKKEYERNSVLIKSNSIPKKNYDQSKTDLEAAVQATQAAKAQADYLKLIAPADGLIIKRDGEIGQMIASNTPVFWLSCCAPLRISTEVDEEDISKVEVGQKVLIRADAFTGQVFHGKVQAITPKGDPIARSYRVRVEFTEETPLQIGMTAETNIIISEKNDAMLLPSSAVSQGKIWLIRDGKLTQQQVSVGAKGVEKTEITNGLDMNDSVVLNPSSDMKEGRKIRAVLTEQSKP